MSQSHPKWTNPLLIFEEQRKEREEAERKREEEQKAKVAKRQAGKGSIFRAAARDFLTDKNSSESKKPVTKQPAVNSRPDHDEADTQSEVVKPFLGRKMNQRP